MQNLILLEYNAYLDFEIRKIEEKNISKIKELKWYGSQAEIIELTKALLENGNLKGKQEDVFKAIQKTFDIELKNVNQAITKFNTREDKTKLLDSLKTSLSKYIRDKIDKYF